MNLRINDVLSYMPDNLKKMLSNTVRLLGDNVQEIRLRINRPLIVGSLNGNFAILPNGNLSPAVGGAYIVTTADVRGIFQLICENSVYAYLEDIRQGFITIKGGHRVGFAGKAVCNDRKIDSFKDISSINIRIAKEILGSANSIMDDIIENKSVVNTLLISPPLVGKTTVLRDITRQVSNKGYKVAVADDRGEIAAMYKGVPQNDIGIQTDVIENAPKKEAVLMMLRSMSPQVIISDEISNEDDAYAVEQCFGTGVSVIGSAHGSSLEEISERKFLRGLLGKGGFKKVILLHCEGSGLNTHIIGKTFNVSNWDR